MTLRNTTQAILITLAATQANASETTSSTQTFSPCQQVKIKDKSLTLTNCTQSDNVTYATYERPESISGSANEFDKERAIIATSTDKQHLLKQSGFRFKSGEPVFNQTKLEVIISPDSVSKRKAIRTLAERGWTINGEDIEYFSPHDRGYVMSCFTAFKGHEKISVTVAQCLDYGELQSFKQLLGKVRIEQ
ncbi:hypothetical protein MKD49_08780 [Herbaspirillum sp. WGmk3]|uniref:hypothetical protein n=1 Tax=Herbaspirillum sp. WGmk3 TaxID=2919925 RepID=UPI0020906C98|nr:hypothetical protein [Herbaspirillum sp. WGmk3]MCO4856574.1 hypothetical protein [Herbaspirillum sp. WGmk3]